MRATTTNFFPSFSRVFTAIAVFIIFTYLQPYKFFLIYWVTELNNLFLYENPSYRAKSSKPCLASKFVCMYICLVYWCPVVSIETAFQIL